MPSISNLIQFLKKQKVGSRFSFGFFVDDSTCPLSMGPKENSYSDADLSGRGKVSYSGRIHLRTKKNPEPYIRGIRSWIKRVIKTEKGLYKLQNLVFLVMFSFGFG